jgi:hypothetical protein
MEKIAQLEQWRAEQVAPAAPAPVMSGLSLPGPAHVLTHSSAQHATSRPRLRLPAPCCQRSARSTPGRPVLYEMRAEEEHTP